MKFEPYYPRNTQAMLKSACVQHPELRYTAGSLANHLRLLRTFAPAGLMDTAVRKDLRLEA